MTTLLLGLLIFLGVHAMRVFAAPLRQSLIAQWGSWRFKAAYALLSLLGFTLILQGYPEAKQLPLHLWEPPFGLRHLSVALMWPAALLLLAAYVPGNGIRARLRHPMTLSVKVWALAHLLANGHWADVLLFGGFLLWSVLLYRAARREDRSQMVGLMGSTGRWLNLGTVLTVLLGSALWYGFALGGWHAPLFGVSPLGR